MRIVFYAGIILVIYTLDFYKKERVDSIKEPSLRAELNRLKFVELKSRVPPQFLLNTLDAVEYNLENNPDLAEEMVADLSDLMRITLDLANIEEVSVREDILHLELYLNLLNKRSGSLITLETDIDPKCYDAFVPTIFYIVPFIEAIYEYSLATEHSLKTFIYEAQCRDDQLYLSVGISDIIISEFLLNEIKRRAGYYELLYPSGYKFYSILNKNELRLLLDIPFKVSDTLAPV
jgi:LytS/YehU family sensor histidine kinase